MGSSERKSVIYYLLLWISLVPCSPELTETACTQQKWKMFTSTEAIHEYYLRLDDFEQKTSYRFDGGKMTEER
jgi:hypothetical protein